MLTTDQHTTRTNRIKSTENVNGKKYNKNKKINRTTSETKHQYLRNRRRKAGTEA